ncbi:unnamed protein product [Arctia plantaginis]|uniref:Transposase n=1 Tax=Arctia plantaginis TaxID=874455 RepID=A0A8S1B626_ARCPL|nr:unnamed protein product [Arctia plantaginis]
MISTASLKAGINENIFKELKTRAERMNTKQKLCLLLFDEISLMPHFDYNRKRDAIIGFVDNGEVTHNKIADHALVFMIRGIYYNYKQAVAYTFCAGSTSKAELAAQIKNIIRKLNSAGFKVMGTICDQGCANVSAINYLIEQTKEKYLKNNIEQRNKVFEIDDEEIIPIYDTPHLLKGIRNNLLTKNLKCKIGGEEKTAKWEHVLQLYKEDPAYQGIRLMPKLTDKHVVPEKIAKMKVKCASQLFSQSVSVNMGYLASKGIISKDCKETADLFLFLDNLFDSLNGSHKNSKKRSGKPLLGPVTPSSGHHKIWREAKEVLKTMKFVTSNGYTVVPSITNWLQSIENIEYLVQKIFTQYDLASLWMRHFNQDPLENFFGSIRSHGYRNITPSCAGFEAAFSSLLINNLSANHSPGSNCEQDSCTVFQSINNIFFEKSEDNNFLIEIDDDLLLNDNILIDIEIKKRNAKTFAQLQYVAGWCKDVNKIINGARTDVDQEDSIQIMAFDYNKKRIKRKK